MLLKSTTRHIRIYTAEVQGNELIESDNVLTLDLIGMKLLYRRSTVSLMI
jgi:Cyanobacterial and plastid NDH-1 subunit M